ncbi:MAG: hypothetical protein IH945_01115 [Armatimonadetes bacterium]|nr:hypothetical protein [Armatimonadota bacterium]
MDFGDWNDAVDQALTTAKRGFTTSQINPQVLWAAFTSNTSPVMFARQAQPMPHVQQAPIVGGPAPGKPSWGSQVPRESSFVVRVTAGALGAVGWIFWGTACYIVFLWIVGLFGVAASSEDVEGAATGVAAWLSLGGPLALIWALLLLVLGSLWHYLAQRLLIAWHDRR